MRRQESWFPNRFTIGPVTKPGTAALDVPVSDGRRPSGRFLRGSASGPSRPVAGKIPIWREPEGGRLASRFSPTALTPADESLNEVTLGHGMGDKVSLAYGRSTF